MNHKKEFDIQKKVHLLFSEPSNVYRTLSNKRLQILSPGKLNNKEGPDFIDIAILLEGNIIVGDSELHLRASDWVTHKHQTDPKYSRTILHIVFENDQSIPENFETLLLDYNQLPEPDLALYPEESDLIDSIEEIQNYAITRLLRKTAEVQQLMEQISPNIALEKEKYFALFNEPKITELRKIFNTIIFKFLSNYLNQRHRPYYSNINLEDFSNAFANSTFFDFLVNLNTNDNPSLTEELFRLMKQKIYTEGNHLRREIIMNCLLPLGLAIANEKARIALLAWFWSAPAVSSYGILTRKFRSIPQNYVWQQQGMLEIIKSKGKQKSSLRDTLKKFKIGEVLTFFQLSHPFI